MYKRSSSTIIGVICTVMAACAFDGTEAAPDPAELASTEQALGDFPPFDFCASGAPDATLLVTGATPTGIQSSASGSGGYFYSKAIGCLRWVVDVRVAAGGLFKEGLQLSGAAYDLPSSTGAGARLPGTPYDCTHWSEHVSFYRKLAAESSFTALGHAIIKGNWNGGCQPYVASGNVSAYATEAAPVSGWDTYRVVVGTKLRSTWQQVIVRADKYDILY